MSLKNALLNDKNAEVLVLGNSHTFFGINPKFLTKKTINVANKSRKLETDYLILRKNISNNKTIKKIILPISYYTMFTEQISIEEKRLYYHFYELKKYNQGFFYNSLILNQPFKELVDDCFFKTTNISNLGWRANTAKYKFDEQNIKERIGDIEKRLSKELTIKKNTNYLNKIIALCNTNIIKLVIILPPYHPDFYNYSKFAYSKKIKKILNKIDLKNCILIDSENLKIKEDTYFENVDHLNENGAIFFTKKIDSIIKINK